MKIKLEEMKKRLSETEKILNEKSDVSESNEKKLKLFQYKYARLSRTWREENLSKQHEIETLKANVREFQKQLENIQNSSDSKSFSIRRDLRDILCVLHSVTSQIVDEGTSESRLAGEMLHGVIERVNSIMSQNDDGEDTTGIKNSLLDDVTASMVKMCQEMEEDSSEKQSVITKLQRALENANSETSTKLLKNQFNKIMKSRIIKRRGVLLRKQSERMNRMSGSSEESKSEKKKKKKKKKRGKRKKRVIPKPPSNLERRARLREESERLREEAEVRRKKVASRKGRVLRRKQKENFVSSNRNVSSSSSPTRRRRKKVELVKPVQRERMISNRVTTRLEDWLNSHVLSEDDQDSLTFLSSNYPGPRNETNMVYSSSSSSSSDDNEEQLQMERERTRSMSRRKESHQFMMPDVEKKNHEEEIIDSKRKEEVVVGVEEDNALQHEISILDQEIRDLKESLESASLALGAAS